MESNNNTQSQLDISDLVNEVLLDDQNARKKMYEYPLDASDPRNVFKTLPQQEDDERSQTYGSMPRQMARKRSRESIGGNSVANKSTVSYTNKIKDKSRSGSRNKKRSTSKNGANQNKSRNESGNRHDQNPSALSFGDKNDKIAGAQAKSELIYQKLQHNLKTSQKDLNVQFDDLNSQIDHIINTQMNSLEKIDTYLENY